ncbi:hypothetical protein GXW83_23465 [Streptacidiphilus sp. PB12-B1b]|uniref:hypothetical protein n=1 Tax=Streptacidiphilus sp. PB12-B1b TaxID=2705012 RepID=UPI0015FA8BD2|nr:hypothetical protein [Streptacidiphilus sp. PB12-B1b]QMU78219.1 hypothetical protein GXW83_23465 [Streptacidiphilus sp. PB12-B1b]
MPLSGDTALRAVADIMRRHGIEEILEVPAVPAASGLRYRRSVLLDPGDEPWYLRTFGTDFEIVPAGRPRRGPSRCYSVGRDLDEQGEREGLLLVQAFTDDRAAAEGLARSLVGELSALAEQVEGRTDQARQRPCCWVAARLPADRHRAAEGGAPDA